jgi:hypothetical protein
MRSKYAQVRSKFCPANKFQAGGLEEGPDIDDRASVTYLTTGGTIFYEGFDITRAFSADRKPRKSLKAARITF